MQVQFDPEALSDLAGAMDWYTARSASAADSFAQEIERAVVRLQESPLRWPPYLHGTRKALLRRFPFALIYRTRSNEIQIVAVAHLHRRPGYWRHRPSG